MVLAAAGGQVRSVAVRLRADVTDYTARMAQAGAATKKFAGDAAASARRVAADTRQATADTVAHAGRHRGAWEDVGQSVAGASAAILAASALAVKGFMDFDAQMSRTAAAADAGAKDLDALRAAAIEAGEATKYSATEAAKAEEELVKAGVAVRDIVGGGLRGALALAAAGDIELADAAELAAQAMNQFALQGRDVPRVADLIAAGAGKAAGSVHEMGYGLKQSGLVASQVGLSIEDTVGSLAAFADNALIGSDAGTSFKTMLQRLVPQTDEQADLMDQLGLAFFDAQGQFVGIDQVAGQLQHSMAGLTAEQRLSAMTTLFGSDAIRAANILYAEGEQGIRRYIDGVSDQGYAQRVASKATDNLKGDIERLGGALETALIGSGGSGSAVLRELAQAATSAVDGFSDLPGPVRESLVVVGLLTGAVGLLGGGFLMLVPRIAATRAALATLNVTGSGIGAWLTRAATLLRGPWGLAIAAGIGAVAYFANEHHKAEERVKSLAETLDEQTGTITRNTREKVAAQLEGEGWLRQAKELGLALHDVTEAALGDESAIRRLDAANRANMASLAGQGQAAASAGIKYGRLRDALTDTSGALGKAIRAQRGEAEAQERVAAAATGAGAAIGVNTAAIVDANRAAAEAEQRQTALKDALDATKNAFLGQRDAARDYQASIDAARDAVKEHGRTLDINTEKGRANEAALDGLARSSMKYLSGILEQKGAGAEFDRALDATRDELVRTAMRFGMTRRQAREYARQILNIPSSASTTVTLVGAGQAIASVSQVARAVRRLDGTVAEVTIVGTEVTYDERGNRRQSSRSRRAMAGGGEIPLSAGSGVRDDVPLMAMAGEFVVQRAAAQANLPLLHAINSGQRVQGMAGGGPVQAVKAPAVQVVRVPVTETHTYSAPVHVGQVVTRDAASFVDGHQRRSFDPMRGVR